MTNDNNSSDRSFGEVSEKPTTDNVLDSDNSEEEVEEGDSQNEESQTTQTEEKPTETKTTDEEPKLTEKGTKLDPNPLSAVHQQLANEKRVREQMERVLNNPQLLAEYMKKQFGGNTQTTEAKTPEVKQYEAKDFESLDDVAKVVNGLQQDFVGKTKSYEEQIAKLSETVQYLQGTARQQQVAGTIERDISNLQGMKELDPKSPEFIEGLEDDIVALYHQLDFDEKSQTYRGQYSIAQLGNKLIETARRARSKGSLQAQTIVKDKSEGKVKTSTKVDEEPDDSQLSPGESIARGISKQFR